MDWISRITLSGCTHDTGHQHRRRTLQQLTESQVSWLQPNAVGCSHGSVCCTSRIQSHAATNQVVRQCRSACLHMWLVQARARS